MICKLFIFVFFFFFFVDNFIIISLKQDFVEIPRDQSWKI